MRHSPHSNMLDTYSLSAPGFDGVSPFAKTSTIHSKEIRQKLYRGGTFGKLHNAYLRPETTLVPNRTVELERNSLLSQSTKFRKKLSINTNDMTSEKELLSYLANVQQSRSHLSSTKSNKNKAHYFSNQTKDVTNQLTVDSKNMFKRSLRGFQSSTDLSRRDLLCNTVEENDQEFLDHTAKEDKYQRISFINAPPKEFLKLLKMSDFDITLVPNDSRRVLIEAIMRDYFLNLIPEYSDFLICKNSRSHIYTILFTGRLVPTCNACSSVTKFEISKDLGFQVLCTSPYCTNRGLYRNALSKFTINNLWPVAPKPDVEVSVHPDDLKKAPIISKLVQSGRFKRADFVRAMANQNLKDSVKINVRPNTTQNTMRPASFSRGFEAGNLNSKFASTLRNNVSDQRPNTVQGLRAQPKSRPGTNGSSRMEIFKGMPILHDIEDQGLFAKKSLAEKVIEEKVFDDDFDGIEQRPVRRKEDNKSMGAAPDKLKRISAKEAQNNNRSYSSTMMRKEVKNVEDDEIELKNDNSFADLQDIVTLMSHKVN